MLKPAFILLAGLFCHAVWADPVTVPVATQPFFSQEVADSPEAVADQLKIEIEAAGLKWLRTVSIQEDTGLTSVKGLVVYFCDIPYMARAKASNEYAGAPGPGRLVVVQEPSGSHVLLMRPAVRRAILDKPGSIKVLEDELSGLVLGSLL